MKVLVTGAAGFIGSALSIKLLDRGDEVVGVDNHNDYYDPRLKENRLDRHLDHLNYEHFRMDIRDKGQVDSLFKKNDFDVVVVVVCPQMKSVHTKFEGIFCSDNGHSRSQIAVDV